MATMSHLQRVSLRKRLPLWSKTQQPVTGYVEEIVFFFVFGDGLMTCTKGTLYEFHDVMPCLIAGMEKNILSLAI